MAAQGLKELAQTKSPKFGHFIVEFATPGIGHILKSAGCDFVLFDLEHSGFGFETVKSAIRYFEAADLPVIVRTPSKDYHHVARAMDMGAEGLMLPMVGNVEEARHILKSMKYTPDGGRGVALQVSHDRYRPGPVVDKFVAANRRSTFFCQIETAEGVDNADAIAALPGVDCLWVGHFDLSVSLGVPGEFGSKTFTDAIARVCDAARKHGKSLGRLVPTVQQGVDLYGQGFDFICYSGDVWVLHDALKDAVRQIARRLRGCRQREKDRGRPMSAPFRVALSGDFRKPDGSPVYPDFDLEPLRRAPNVEFAYLEPCNPVEAEQLADFDALILLAHRFTKDSIHPNGRLAVVARFGVGYDTVDVEACTQAGIALAITPDGVRRPVAVSIIAFILALTGKLMIKDRLTREGAAGFARRGDHMGVGLVGRTLGSIGIGNIGAELFRLIEPFGMKSIAYDPYANSKLAAELGVEIVGLEEVFRRADIVSVSCPLTPDTQHLVNAERLAMMKPTAYLINTARGPIVDQKALTKVLQDRRIAGAGLDVLEKEPPEVDDPILKLDNVILAPHALCWTDQCFAGNGAADVRAVLDVQHGREPRVVVNRSVLETAAWKRRLSEFRMRSPGD